MILYYCETSRYVSFLKGENVEKEDIKKGKLDNLIVIGFYKSGNIVRFYLGDKSEECHDENCDLSICSKDDITLTDSIKGYVDVCWNLDYLVKKASDFCLNSPGKEEPAKNKVPIIAVKKKDSIENNCSCSFSDFIKEADENIYLGDDVVRLSEAGYIINGKIK